MREKTLVNFEVLWLFKKVFSTKFGGVAYYLVAPVSISQKENLIFHQFAKLFSLVNVSCYTVIAWNTRNNTKG